MKYLLDTSAATVRRRMREYPALVAGQLLTPLTQYVLADALPYAIDNGAFTCFHEGRWLRLLRRYEADYRRCLFVVAPDVVGDALATGRRFDDYVHALAAWPRALALQDGFDGCLPTPCEAVFVGGTNRFKDSRYCLDVVAHCVALGMHVHVGRVNSAKRYLAFAQAGAHTCDGSGVSRFDYMLAAIAGAVGAQQVRRSLW